MPSYRGYRYPAEIISYAVWLYYRFSLSLRDVEELLAERGVTVTYETIRAWCAKFGPIYAAGLRQRRARPSDKWHLDEVQLKMKGKRHWLWRAVDKHGVVLDILVQQRRDQLAAETFLRRVLPSSEHRRHKGLNNRAENSHQPTRQRERAMRRVQVAGASAAISRAVRRRRRSLPNRPLPHPGHRPTTTPGGTAPHVARGGRPSTGSAIGDRSLLARAD
jgi:putative transposase